ncbi:MAG: cyclic nucleotide-binding domain-containing protein [Calditrichales bacterium]|nr:MAG: cyclic nucleotide-binding domain-containing protein [Calditrichales bacterium]
MIDPLIIGHLSFYQKVSLFEGLNEKQLKSIMEIMTLSEIKKGDLITREGEIGDSMFILIKGEVEISKSLFLPQMADQAVLQEKALIRLNDKQYPFFGEMALFIDQPERSASIKAVKPCTLTVIQKKALLTLLERDHTIKSIIFMNIGVVLTKRLIKANKDILKLTTAFSLALQGE